MSIQPVSALVAAIVTFALGGSVLLREPRRGAHVLFATFAFNIAIYCALSFVAKRFESPLWDWASLLAAVSLPSSAWTQWAKPRALLFARCVGKYKRIPAS